MIVRFLTPLPSLCRLLPLANGFAFATGAAAADLTLQQAARAPNRSPEFVARDSARHPVEELRFFGVKSRSSVIEIGPAAVIGRRCWRLICAKMAC